jgi:endonuclease YncB( thermonuclease family)
MKKIILMMALVASLFAWDEAIVKHVVDGDTLMLQKGNQEPFKVRLIAIDTFETKVNERAFMQLETLKDIHPNNPQHKDRYIHSLEKVLGFGGKAKSYVQDKYLNKTIKYYSYGFDKYDRELVWIDVLNFSLVRQGLAVYYPNNKISPERKAYLLDLSREANLEKRGIYNRLGNDFK